MNQIFGQVLYQYFQEIEHLVFPILSLIFLFFQYFIDVINYLKIRIYILLDSSAALNLLPLCWFILARGATPSRRYVFNYFHSNNWLPIAKYINFRGRIIFTILSIYLKILLNISSSDNGFGIGYKYILKIASTILSQPDCTLYVQYSNYYYCVP